MPGPDLPPLIGGKYRPVRVIGKGGMGVVYEVEHVLTGQRFALKLLSEQPGASVERFKREARAVSRIQSDHVVRVTDADVAPELGGAHFLVMDLLEGEDLERVSGGRPVAPADVVMWLRQVARGLGKAHVSGIVHRDLKPENLFLTRREDGSPLVKILDFGLAKMAADANALTRSDSFLGTPGFMAPEQTDSRGPPVTPRADLYALGLIAFKLLVGRTYWKPGSLAQLLAQVLAEPMPPPSERGSSLGPTFDAWFLRACDRDPAGRFESAGEQVEALARALGLPEQSRTSEPPREAILASSEAPSLSASSTDLSAAKRKRARRRWRAGLGLAAGAAAIAAGALFARGGAYRQGTAAANSVADLGVSPSAQASAAAPTLEASGRALAPAWAATDSSDAAPPSAPSASPKPLPRPAAAPAGKKPPAAASSVKVDAPKPRDPLEGAY
jgi:serine/threonine-protein kinase